MKAYGRKWFVRWAAAFVSIVLFGTYLGSLSMNTLTVSAICCRKDGFDKSRYTLTGNVAQDVATIAKSQAGRTCSDFGYSGVDYGAWCDEYVADCLENAGCDDSIVAHGGTVADFENKMRKRGAVVVSSPQPGDLLFFSWSHVEIVTRVEGGTVYCAGGNNQGKTYPGGRCAGERNAQSVAKSMGGSIRLYLRPNYPNPNPPTVSNISIDKALYAVGENVVFHVSSDTATQYTIGIHKNGVPYEILWDFTESSYEYKLTEPGDYYAYLSASNSAGYKDSSGVWFTVYDSKPTTSTLLIPKLNYVAGEPVEFSFTSDTAETFTLGIHRNGVPFDIVYDIKENNYLYTFTEPGDYYAYLCSTNSFGYTNSNGVWFTVYNSAPSISILSTDKHTYSLGENIVFHTESDTATTYSIGLYKDGVRYDSFWDFTENEYMYTSIEPGEYSAYVTSYNSLGYKDSDYIYFTILPSLGDLNSDNKITSDDLFLLQSYLTNNITLTESQGKAADLNEDGLVDGFDLALLRQKLA
mgnify:CR=1 FL=1